MGIVGLGSLVCDGGFGFCWLWGVGRGRRRRLRRRNRFGWGFEVLEVEMVFQKEGLGVGRGLLSGAVCWRCCWMWRSWVMGAEAGEWVLRLLVGASVWQGGGEVVLALR